jgi:transposase
MSLRPHVIQPVPAETTRVARAAFPHESPYLTFRDALGTIFQDEDFAALFPVPGQPGLPPWRLALVTIMGFLHIPPKRYISGLSSQALSD